MLAQPLIGIDPHEVVEIVNSLAIALAKSFKAESINFRTRALEYFAPPGSTVIADAIIVSEDPDAFATEQRQCALDYLRPCAEDRNDAERAEEVNAFAQGESFRRRSFAPCEVKRCEQVWPTFDERDCAIRLSFAKTDRPSADASWKRPSLTIYFFPDLAIQSTRLSVDARAIS
jgi:hypothetical protein